MNNLVKKITMSISAVIFGIFTTSSIFAMSPTYPNDAKFSRGVSNAYYYVDSSASSYTSKINEAVNNWVDTGYGWNPIYLYPVSSNYATHIDYYVIDYRNDAVLSNINNNAYTTFWDINELELSYNVSGEPTSDYYYTEVKITNYREIDTSTIIHEMGHCFGLKHSSNLYSIMYPTSSLRMVNRVAKDDHDTINYLYN